MRKLSDQKAKAMILNEDGKSVSHSSSMQDFDGDVDLSKNDMIMQKAKKPKRQLICRIDLTETEEDPEEYIKVSEKEDKNEEQIRSDDKQFHETFDRRMYQL